MTGRHVRVFECLPVLEMSQACFVLLSSINLRIVIPYPPADLEEANCCVLGISLNLIDVRSMQFFSVQEAGLL